MSEDLKGKVAIISGGAGAIGSATARTLATNGARVVIADLPASPMQAVAEELRGAGLEVIAHPLDLADESSIEALMAATLKAYGRIDILDNNGAMKGLPGDKDVMSMSAELWDQVLGTNARGTMLMCKHALPSMIAGGGGSIINISSGTSMAGDMAHTAYAVSKGAINTLTTYLATQYGPRGVRCNALLVGLVETPVSKRILPPPLREILAAHTVVGRLGQPHEVAELVSFLASDRAAWVTGQLWSIDGGFFAHQPTAPQFAAAMKG